MRFVLALKPCILLFKEYFRDLKDAHRVESLETLRISLSDLLDPTSKGMSSSHYRLCPSVITFLYLGRYWLVGSAFAAPSAREQQTKKDNLIEAETGIDVEVSFSLHFEAIPER